jgi:hypothetical protein
VKALCRAGIPLVASIAVSCPAPALADLLGVDPGTARGDGVYGRFDGDVDLGIGLGGRLGAPGFGPNLRLSGHFLSTIGLCADLTLPVTGDEGWSLGTAIDLRPLFLPRWALDLQQGPAFVDLLVDSISVSAGPVFHPLGESDVGFGLEAGFALPLSERAQGLWLDVRGSGRWVGEASPWGGLLSLSWHTSLLTPIVD